MKSKQNHLGATIEMSPDNSNINLSSISLLIPKCRQGDSSARDALLAEMQGFLSLVADQNMDSGLRSKVGASDIVQDSLVKIVERFEQFNGSTSIEFRGWLKRIVINEIKSKRRAFQAEKRDLRREMPIDSNSETIEVNKATTTPKDDRPTPSSQVMARERIEKFYHALSQLSPDHAEVIRLRNIERLPFKEIGEKMGRSEDAVSQLWFRAILNFEDRLKSMGQFQSDNSQK